MTFINRIPPPLSPRLNFGMASRVAKPGENPGPNEKAYIQPSTGQRMIENDPQHIKILTGMENEVRRVALSQGEQQRVLLVGTNSQGYVTLNVTGHDLRRNAGSNLSAFKEKLAKTANSPKL